MSGLPNAEIYDLAQKAGQKAGEAFTPTPMVVGRAVGLTGNEIVPGSEEIVYEGVCGFAWVNVKPKNCSFAKFAVAGINGYHESYYGGIDIWCRLFDQSMERKEAWANAFAEVLNEHGIRAYPMSRMD